MRLIARGSPFFLGAPGVPKHADPGDLLDLLRLRRADGSRIPHRGASVLSPIMWRF
jgi:hypothetical protein